MALTREDLEKMISEYSARFQEARKFESEENARDDTALAWGVGLKDHRERPDTWRWWSRRFFLLSHGLMALGVIAVTALILLYNR